MNKLEFEKVVEKWIEKFVESNPKLSLEEIFKKKNISKESHPVLNNMTQSKNCDFICDYIALVKHDTHGYQLILINRFVKSIGIKDIGEMLVYAKIANPLYAFLISVNGHSTEINTILVNQSIAKPLFQYDADKHIILFALGSEIKKESVLPVHMRGFFLGRG